LNGENGKINDGENGERRRRNAKEIANYTKPPQTELCVRIRAKSEKIGGGFRSPYKQSAQPKYSHKT
jgi:hypothetical protein